ncbi:hypothetical protein BT63DRAFT_454834 [Microthyrium microscopicum]|uniref:Uncharacterized protein n=1 Tax=Microthyrium microscopicum TaxID=703497 RepID=A0A6A6UG67_9PEZI|nr:hypothetical protein BT63DRAFT_454834 [Microthyrium microscopicum]
MDTPSWWELSNPISSNDNLDFLCFWSRVDEGFSEKRISKELVEVLYWYFTYSMVQEAIEKEGETNFVEITSVATGQIGNLPTLRFKEGSAIHSEEAQYQATSLLQGVVSILLAIEEWIEAKPSAVLLTLLNAAIEQRPNAQSFLTEFKKHWAHTRTCQLEVVAGAPMLEIKHLSMILGQEVMDLQSLVPASPLNFLPLDEYGRPTTQGFWTTPAWS